MMFRVLFLGMALAYTGQTKMAAHSPPHILNIFMGDVGWNDVSWRSKPDYRGNMHMPFLSKLKKKGVELLWYYTNPTGVASRAAFATGIDASKLGVRSLGLPLYARSMNFSLSLKYKLLQEYLQEQGYSTHMVGKWRLGFCDWAHTPIRRGFETFCGSLGGNAGYFNHSANIEGFYDFWHDDEVDLGANGTYVTDLLTKRVKDIVSNHSASGDNRPLYIHLAHEALHKPLEIPTNRRKGKFKKCNNVSNLGRQLRCIMMLIVDDGVKDIMNTLEKVKYHENLLVMFTADNGGSGDPAQGASNYPLRGRKGSLYEAGTRVPAFLYGGKLLAKAKKVFEHPMHITDWFPTLATLAGETIDQPGVTGINMWDVIANNADHPSPNRIIVYDVDVAAKTGAIRQGDYKLIYLGQAETGKCIGWRNFPPEEKRKKRVECKMWELYNLKDDPSEETDKSEELPDVLEALKREYRRIEDNTKPYPALVNATKAYEVLIAKGGVWTPYDDCGPLAA